MRKILCVAKQEKKESEKRGVPEKIKNVIKDIFCDPEDVSEKTKDLLSEFEKTDTYKSMSAEFKSQLKSLMGYEYESESDAEEGIMQLLRCFESQKEPDLEIKVSTKKGYTVSISDNRKDRKIPNTYTGKLSFKISDKISITSVYILSLILSPILARTLLVLVKISSWDCTLMLCAIFWSIDMVLYTKLKKMRNITTPTTFVLLVKAIMFLALLFISTKNQIVGFLIICLIALFFVFLISDSSSDEIKKWLSRIIGIVPVGIQLLEMLINKKG